MAPATCSAVWRPIGIRTRKVDHSRSIVARSSVKSEKTNAIRSRDAVAWVWTVTRATSSAGSRLSARHSFVSRLRMIVQSPGEGTARSA